MILIEIPPNPNCEAVEQRVFHDLTPPQPVSQVRIEKPVGSVQWCDVTGWTVEGTPCPALMHKVDDSGEGVAWLVSGGNAGLRLQEAGRRRPWRLDDPRQWGLPFLLITDLVDVKLAEPPELLA